LKNIIIFGSEFITQSINDTVSFEINDLSGCLFNIEFSG